MSNGRKNCCFYLDDECQDILEQARWLLRSSKNKIITDLIKGALYQQVSSMPSYRQASHTLAVPKGEATDA